MGGRGGFGGPGGNGGFGGRQRSEDSPDNRNKIQELTNEVRNPSTSLVISHSDPSLAITDARGRTRLFQTNGKKDIHQLDAGTIESKTSWEGSRLVTEYDLGNGRKLRYTYSLLPDTKQLLEQVTFERAAQAGRTRGVVKHVYDPARVKLPG